MSRFTIIRKDGSRAPSTYEKSGDCYVPCEADRPQVIEKPKLYGNETAAFREHIEGYISAGEYQQTILLNKKYDRYLRELDAYNAAKRCPPLHQEDIKFAIPLDTHLQPQIISISSNLVLQYRCIVSGFSGYIKLPESIHSLSPNVELVFNYYLTAEQILEFMAI